MTNDQYRPNLLIASDHAGYELKQLLKKYLIAKDYILLDLGTDSKDSVDYPDFAKSLAEALLKQPNAFGILICGTGIGMSIAVNRYSHVRAALCHNTTDATLARQHNNANILILAGRFITENLAKKIIDSFLTTDFLHTESRHVRRVSKLNK